MSAVERLRDVVGVTDVIAATTGLVTTVAVWVFTEGAVRTFASAVADGRELRASRSYREALRKRWP